MPLLSTSEGGEVIAATDPYAVIDREPPDVEPDGPPHPDGESEGFCPRCGERLTFESRDEYVPALGRTVVIVDGWGYCEGCAQDDALDRMRQRTPWLFAEPGTLDEHDVLGDAVRRGVDGYELVR